MTSPHAESPQVVNLQQLKIGITQRVGPQFAERIDARMAESVVTRDLVMRITGYVLAEELPPTTTSSLVGFTVPRFATWWDHFKAAKAERWWMWTLRDLRWVKPPRFVDEPHTHATDVKVRTYWTYPRATTVLPGRDFGHVVLKTHTSRDGYERPW